MLSTLYSHIALLPSKPLRHLAMCTHHHLLSSLKSQKINLSLNLLPEIRSKDSIRFTYDGFDIDLSYITPNIIAISFPSASSLTHNSISEIKRFLHNYHDNRYKIYNLCKETIFPSQNIFNEQEYIPIPQNCPPSLKQIDIFCNDAMNYIKANSDNVIVVTSKEGKGRAGTFISCLLLKMKMVVNAKDAMTYFAAMRSRNNKGIVVPSQKRYVCYYDYLIHNKVLTNKIIITSLKMKTVPKVSFFKRSCRPVIVIENDTNVYNSEEHLKLKEYSSNTEDIVFDIKCFHCSGDVTVRLYHKGRIGKDKLISKVSFNTFFVPRNGEMIIEKKMIDEACNDEDNKIFSNEFRIEVHYVLC